MILSFMKYYLIFFLIAPPITRWHQMEPTTTPVPVQHWHNMGVVLLALTRGLEPNRDISQRLLAQMVVCKCMQIRCTLNQASPSTPPVCLYNTHTHVPRLPSKPQPKNKTVPPCS